jgi:hypothetical protein
MGKISGPVKPNIFVTVAAETEKPKKNATKPVAEKYFVKRFMVATCQQQGGFASLFADEM